MGRGDRRSQRREAAPIVEAFENVPGDVAGGVSAVDAPSDPLAFVMVSNKGLRRWIGSDYRPGGSSSIAGGGVGRTTRKRAEMLVRDFAAADGNGAGPFEIVPEGGGGAAGA